MKQGKPMKRTAMNRTAFKRPDRPEKKLPALCKPSNWSTASGVIDKAKPQPKKPALRIPALRDLAAGEECTVRHPLHCNRRTDTTVLCHTNTQADCKGMGYKGHDQKGFFGCAGCHAWIDSGSGNIAEKKASIASAQKLTAMRLIEIASSVATKPWRVRAARQALDYLSKGVSYV